MNNHPPTSPFSTQVFLPYLVRAAYEWITDNNMTPYLLVNTTYPGVVVPSSYIKNDKIVLDITPRAVNHLKISNEVVEFEARFGNKICFVSIPMISIVSLYARENGCGMTFSPTLSIDMNDKNVGNSTVPSSAATSPSLPPAITLIERKSSLKAKTTTSTIKTKNTTKATTKPKLVLVKKVTEETPTKPQDE